MSGYNLTDSFIVYRMQKTAIPIGGISMGIVAGKKVAFMDYIDDEELEKDLCETFKKHGYSQVIMAYRYGNGKLVKYPNSI